MGRERSMTEFSGQVELDASDTELAEGMRIETPTKLSRRVKVTVRGVGTAPRHHGYAVGNVHSDRRAFFSSGE
jgi:hypothetical protein